MSPFYAPTGIQWTPEPRLFSSEGQASLGAKSNGVEEWKIDLGWDTQKLLERGRTVVLFSLWISMVSVPSYFATQAQTMLLIIQGRKTTCVCDSKL